MSVLSLLNILASCAVKGCPDEQGHWPELIGTCVFVLVVLGVAMLINRNLRE